MTDFSNTRIRPEQVALGDALDMPPEIAPIQDAYWQLRREWEEMQFCYLRVIEDMVSRYREVPRGTGRGVEVAPGVWGTPPDGLEDVGV